MIGPILNKAVRTVTETPTLGQEFVRVVVKAAAAALGSLAVGGAARVVRDQYERHQSASMPQLQNQNARRI